MASRIVAVFNQVDNVEKGIEYVVPAREHPETLLFCDPLVDYPVGTAKY